jgi:hypothetical protein
MSLPKCQQKFSPPKWKTNDTTMETTTKSTVSWWESKS